MEYTFFYKIKNLIYESSTITTARIKYFGDCIYSEDKLPVRYAEELEINFNPPKAVLGVDVTEELTKSWIDAELTDEVINPIKERLKIRLEETANQFIENEANHNPNSNLPWENTPE